MVSTRVAAVVLLVPCIATAGFLEARNAVGVFVQTFSGPQQAFYRDLGAQLQYEGYPRFAYGLGFRSFGSERVGAELVFNYASKSGALEGLGLSTTQVYLGPVFSIPIIGQGERLVPFGCAGVVVVRSAIDIDSQLDMGLYLKLGVQGVITDHLGIAAMLAYTRVSIGYDAGKGLGGAGYTEKKYPFGDGSVILELSYFP